MSGAPPPLRRPDLYFPAECRDLIERGALVVLNHSGGKDSQAMTILVSREVPLDQLLVVHAPLGEVEWPGTIEHFEATLPAGVALIMAPVSSGKSLLDRPTTITRLLVLSLPVPPPGSWRKAGMTGTLRPHQRTAQVLAKDAAVLADSVMLPQASKKCSIGAGMVVDPHDSSF